MNNKIAVEKEIGGRVLSIETGVVAKQTSGSVMIKCGDSVVLCTTTDGGIREGVDFFPLLVEYQEKMFASGKIPGGFLKREGRMSSRETLVSRMIDRGIRPNFPDGYAHDVQITAQVLSHDPDVDPAILAMTGASAALAISHMPFSATLGSVKIGNLDGELLVNPTPTQLAEGDLDLLVTGSKDSIMMVECGAKEIAEEKAVEGLTKAQEVISDIVDLIDELASKAGKEKEVYESPENTNPMMDKLLSEEAGLIAAFRTPEKHIRGANVKVFKTSLKEKYLADVSEEEMSDAEENFSQAFDNLKTVAMRSIIFSGERCDGRDLKTVRPIEIETKFLPRTHGSALFTRGETQAIVTSTLGSLKDCAMVDDLDERRNEFFMLHYNFPQYSVGETGPNRGVGRREVGHGTLAQRALKAVLPAEDSFPYTIRIVSDITESNGSSSMASVCGGSLSMMDAGIPISAPVAGIAMGLCKDGDKEAILSDILGDEDHYGDMDFKVTGTKKGITALQMDIKIKGLTRSTLESAMEQAKAGRLHILGEMDKAISAPREELSAHAPQIKSIKVKEDQIGKIIGPGGSNIKDIVAQSGADVNIEDDGTVKVYGNNKDSIEKAISMIEDITAVPEIGKGYAGVVKSVKDFGAFVEYMAGHQGLLHVSEISDDYVKEIDTVISLGDEIRVVVSSIDKQNRVKLVREEKYKAQQSAE
jgi:polyribonucleotide nucleotidyltransferase